MKLLALDAATEACSVAIKVDPSINKSGVVSYYEVCPQQHSQKLLPAVHEVLESANLKLSDLDGFIYGRGPGSFTGVRIGVSITQGLAFGADLKVVGVSNLALMAQQAIDEQGADIVIAAIDARMSEIYFAIYKNVEGVATEVFGECVCKPENLSAILKGATEGDTQINIEQLSAKDSKNENKTICAVGTGWQAYAGILPSAVSSIVDSESLKITDILLPDVKFGFKLAEPDFANGLAQNAEHAQPNYVRDEVTWKKLPGR